MLDSKLKTNKCFKFGILLLAIGVVIVPLGYAFVEYIKQDAIAEKERFAKERALEEAEALKAEYEKYEIPQYNE